MPRIPASAHCGYMFIHVYIVKLFAFELAVKGPPATRNSRLKQPFENRYRSRFDFLNSCEREISLALEPLPAISTQRALAISTQRALAISTQRALSHICIDSHKSFVVSATKPRVGTLCTIRPEQLIVSMEPACVSECMR